MEQRLWRRLPVILLWGTLLPIGLAALNHALATNTPESGAADGALLQWDFAMLGVIVLHWTVVLTVGLGCFIVRVMKGPAYVADAYEIPLPDVGPDRGTGTPLESPQDPPTQPR